MTNDAAPAGMAAPFNTDITPVGERALATILEHVLKVGDEAETDFLEIKGPLDITKKGPGLVKVVKFLLGAANRQPGQAASHFHGYAVLVIGVQDNAAHGVPRGVELHDLENRLRPYLGPEFPSFEFGRLAVQEDREVLFVIASPPQDGQSPFICQKEFQGDNSKDTLSDGAIYVRGKSNTRPAKAAEVTALLKRAQGGGKPPIELDVQIRGSVSRVELVHELIEWIQEATERQFVEDGQQSQRASLLTYEPTSLYARTQPRTPAERNRRLQQWKAGRSRDFTSGREHFLGVCLSGVGIRALSTGRYVSRPELTVTFHDCEVFDHLDPDDADPDEVVELIVQSLPDAITSAIYRPRPMGYPVKWGNHDNDARIVLTPDAFRPDTPWDSSPKDMVIVARDAQAASVQVTWTLTEEGNDLLTRGDFYVPTLPVQKATDLYKQFFGRR